MASSYKALILACLGVTLTMTRTASSHEPAAEFLEGLRNRGYYDVAFAYLDQIADSRCVRREIKDAVPYERTLTLIDLACVEADFGRREESLDRADAELASFLTTSKSHSALHLQAELTLERARAKVSRANESGVTPAERKQWMAQARDLYDTARERFLKIGAEQQRQMDELGRGQRDSLRW